MDKLTIKWWIDRCINFEKENEELKKQLFIATSRLTQQEAEIARLERTQQY
jgi:hypothetical protein